MEIKIKIEENPMYIYPPEIDDALTSNPYSEVTPKSTEASTNLELPIDMIFRLPVDGKFITAKLHYWKQKKNKRGYDAWLRFDGGGIIPTDLQDLEFPSLNSATRALKSSNKCVLKVWYIKEDGLYNRSLEMVKDAIICDTPKNKFNWTLSQRSKQIIKDTRKVDRSHNLLKKHPMMGSLIQTYSFKNTQKRYKSVEMR